MFIKIYILTYNNNFVLNEWCLKTLFESDIGDYNHQINILNNHSNLIIDDKYIDKVIIHNNNLRPDFSCGHIPRDWNSCLIDGFKNLNKPECDIVICVQNDEKFKKYWVKNLLKYHKKYNFISFGSGDGFLSFLPESIKKIGLFDENFLCGKHEQDFFLRAYLYNREKSSINDYCHSYSINMIENNIMERTLDGNDSKRENEAKEVVKTYLNYQKPARIFFKKKWGKEHFYQEIKENNTKSLPSKPILDTIMLYPYFEKDIENLNQKGYIT